MEGKGLGSCSSLLAGSNPHLHLQGHFSGNSHSHDAKYLALFLPEHMPTHQTQPFLGEVTRACQPLASSPSLPYHINKQGDQKEGLTQERESQRTHAADSGCLPLLSALIPLFQSPGNQGKERANKKGPGTKEA